MRAALIVLAVPLAACSQIFGLDSPYMLPDAPRDVGDDGPSPDTLAGCGVHDFDLDGIADDCDMCPYIASANVDSDADGVGDECDPRPLKGGDARKLWLAFYNASDITGWTSSDGAWAVSANLLHRTDASFSLLDSPMSYSTDLFFATSLIITQANSAEVGFCAADIQPSVQYYCCAVGNPTSGANVRAASQYSGSSGQISVPGTLSANLSPGQRVEITGMVSGSTFDCRFSQAGASAAMVQTPAGGRTGPVAFYATTRVDYRYVFVVTVAP